MIGAAAAPASFPVGWYGKIPVTGDFIARRLATAFSEPWDRWLQGVMDGSRERLGARWRDTFLSMPAWRFILAPGMVTPNAWAGLMVPSVDAVGRYFPLTVAVSLPSESGLTYSTSSNKLCAYSATKAQRKTRIEDREQRMEIVSSYLRSSILHLRFSTFVAE